MIITCKKEVPFRWIAFAILPWASFTFNGYIVGVAFLFSLKKFVENPAGLTFILSLPGFVSMVLQPVAGFTSDRIWTRFGRRKPFIVAALTGVTLCLILLPLMPNFWCLLGVFILLNIFGDLNAPMEPLKQEIIPPQERGRATGAMSWCSNLACMVFYFVALGRFDDVRYLAGFPLFGETAIYWSAALLMAAMVLLVALGIREIDQKSALCGERLSLRNFAGGLLDQELWPVYMLVVGAACLNYYAGLGPLSNLLYTDQWGYTKQEMGINIAVGGVINMFAIGILTVFADRLNRMRAYQTLICMSLAGNVLYYCYVNFVLPDKHPSLIEIIVFGETLSILSILTGLVYIPLVYDYVKRNKMGTYNAGASLVNRLTVLITLNGVGLFVWGYAKVFQPPAGEMTRVVVRDDQAGKAEILAELRAASWTYPADGAPAASSSVAANAWQSTGTVTDKGRCWEVRLRDKASETLAGDKENLNKESTPLVTEEEMLRDKAAILKKHGKTDDALREAAKADAKKVRIDQLNAQVKAIDAQLDARAEIFHGEVAKVFGNRLLAEGDQVIGASTGQALILELATSKRPDGHWLERALRELRAGDPAIIDMRPVESGSGYGIAVSRLLDTGADQAAVERGLRGGIETIAAKSEPGLLVPGAAPLGRSVQTALTLELMVIEEPLDTYVSPITRVVNLVLAPFDRVPSADRRLTAMARSLRAPGNTDHIRVNTGPEPKSLSITAVLPAVAPKGTSSNDPVGRRLQTLLGKNGTDETIEQARAFYDRVEIAAAAQHLTVAHPTLISGYAPMKYDYMSGYLWMFMMSLVGIAITIAFVHFEAKGFIRKRGVEEALES